MHYSILTSLLKTIHVSETFNDSRLLFVLVFSPVLPLKSQTLEAFVQLRELTASISVLESGIANLQGDVKELQEPSVNEIAKWHAVKHLWWDLSDLQWEDRKIAMKKLIQIVDGRTHYTTPTKVNHRVYCSRYFKTCLWHEQLPTATSLFVMDFPKQLSQSMHELYWATF